MTATVHPPVEALVPKGGEGSAERYDLLVIGAGPAGLSAARAAAASGASVALIESHPIGVTACTRAASRPRP
jgi:flavin-dependent dehydrogenase